MRCDYSDKRRFTWGGCRSGTRSALVEAAGLLTDLGTQKSFEQNQQYWYHANSTTMPFATSTKSAMTGTKRKSAPVKNGNVKESKKAKIEPVLKSAMKSKSSKAKSVPFKKVEESSDDDSDDLDSDGGAPLDPESSASDVEMEDGGSDEAPKVADGVHPDRAKAVVANSKVLHPTTKELAFIPIQVNPLEKHT